MDDKNTSELNIVGIGASAGGLEALEAFFVNMPSDTGLSFVVVQHLSPESESILSQILQRYTEMPVMQVVEETAIEPNHIYVIPPKHDIGAVDNILKLYEPTAPRGFHLPVDFLFRSLADHSGARTAGVVLSGTGSDGSLGVKAIKGEGGLTIAQDPVTTRFTGMPLTAINTRMVDHVVPVEEMPGILVHYFDNYPLSAETLLESSFADKIQVILTLLKDHTGHDFSQYKPNTMVRRIERRMVINRIENLAEYLRYLDQNEEELGNLFDDLLIGVTRFFRDLDAFAALKTQVISRLLDNKSELEEIRVWVPACSTGEEAITIAILIDEMLSEAERTEVNVQIFATDIDRRAIVKAREGLFPANISTDIPANYFKKYFTSDSPNVYRLSKKIRRQLVFSEHSLIKDPPFSKLDLISCRNLLIYLNSNLQKIALNIMHYALKDSGYLFLGDSETISGADNLFTTLNQRHRIFQKLEVDSSIQVASRLYTPSRYNAISHTATVAEKAKQIENQVQSTLLKEYVPPSVMIDEEGEILYHQGNTIKFWSTPTGQASWNILHIARPEIAAPIAVGINHVINHKQVRVFKGLEIDFGDYAEVYDIHMRPTTLLNQPGIYIIISFEQHIQNEQVGEIPMELTDDLIAKRIQELEDEILLKDEYIQATLRQLDDTNANLNSITEEFQTSTEELRSSNEELETSREELQAINEELLTMNAELNENIDQLNQLSDDQRNILSSMHTGLLLLNEDHTIRVFNDIAARIFNIIETDIKRPISQLAPRFDYSELHRDIEGVINTFRPKIRDIVVDDEYLQLRIDPYRTGDGDIEGTIITLVDITERKRIENQLRENQEMLQKIVDALPVGVHILNKDREVVLINEAFKRIFGVGLNDATQTLYETIRFMDRGKQLIDTYQLPSHRAIAGRKAIYNQELGFLDETGEIKWLSVSVSPLNTSDLSAVVVNADITDKMKQDNKLRENEQRFAEVLVNTNTVVFEQGRDLKYSSIFNYHLEDFPQGIIGLSDPEFMKADDAERLLVFKKEVLETGQQKRFDFRSDGADTLTYFDVLLQPIFDDDGQTVIGIRGSGMDITQRKKAELELVKLTQELQRVLTLSNTSAWEQDLDLVYTRLLNPNPNFRVEDTIGKTDYDILHPDDVPHYVSVKQQVLETGDMIRKDMSVKAGGELYYYDIRLDPLFDDDGETIIGLIGASTDITERKIAVQNLEFQSHILNNIAESIHLVQVETGNIVYINPKFEVLFGYRVDEILGQHVSILNDPNIDDPQATAAKIIARLQKNKSWRGEVNNIKKDGTRFVSSASVSTFTHPKYGEVWVSMHQEIEEKSGRL